MDEIDRRLLDDMKSELVLRKREKQHLSEKLDCLILLIRRAWQGDKDAITHISQIVGIPSPSILPPTEETQENGETGQEYLNLTSDLLDEQLAGDKDIKRATKVLRPTSARRIGTRRVKSANVFSCTQPTTIGTDQISPIRNTSSTNEPPTHYDHPSIRNQPKPAVQLPMGDLHDIIPLFSKPNPDVIVKPKIDDSNERNFICEEKESNILFDPEGIVGSKKTRPVSAALQRRHDFIRSQGKKKARPHSAISRDKPAFRHSTDSEYETLVRTHHGMPSPEGLNTQPNPSPRSPLKENSPPGISINISPKRQGRKAYRHQSNFPHARDDQAFGDVADALQRVQEMERMFRLNTKRLQKKIGIPAEGCI